MHLLRDLTNEVHDATIAQQAAAQQLITPPLSDFSITAPRRNALLLGYTAVSQQEISAGLCRLRAILQQGYLSGLE
ncbi:MAG: hypothetical protein H0U76_21655 [Ktedonobacteraceae bacterium]|nr:hypothetical protein [Ktedonobacteraceae bacterium]